MMRNYLFILLMLFLLTSCFKKDEKVLPHDPGDVEVAQVDMMKDYRYQAYFDLESGNLVSENLKTDWDLGFETSDTGWHVILNTGNFMWAGKTASTDFSQSIDTTGLVWKFDNSDGNLDSTAIGKWFSVTDGDTTFPEYVYAINRGYTPAGDLRGVKKIAIRSVNANEYLLAWGNVNDSEAQLATIVKDSSRNFVFFSFDNGGEQKNLEPDKRDWDLWFTQYTTILFTNEGDPYPYLVTGVLINRLRNVRVAEDTLLAFDEIDFNLAQQLNYFDSLDVIGYDWKDVVGDVQSGNVSYIVNDKLLYVIRTQDDFYYKLRFVDFYNDLGDKGYPKFEFQRL